LVDQLETVVSLGNVERNVVRVPAELLRRRDQSPLDSLPVAGIVDERVEEHSGGLKRKFVIDNRGLWQSLDLLLGLSSGRLETALGGSDEVVQDILNGLNSGGLNGVLVVEKGETSVRFPRVGDAKIDELEDNGLEDVVGSVLESFSTLSGDVLAPTHDWNTSQRFSKACCWDCAVPRARSSSER